VRLDVRVRNANLRAVRFVAVSASATSPVPTHPPSRRLIWLLTIATGASVANLYYNQPLLSDIARTFHATSRAAGIIATLTQAGYAVGMLLFVPLGDVVERRRLIVILLCCVTGALLLAASGPTLSVVAAASFAIGVTTVVPQLILPFAAGLSPPAMRGRVVGTVVSGLLVGILAGRAVAERLGLTPPGERGSTSLCDLHRPASPMPAGGPSMKQLVSRPAGAKATAGECWRC